MKAFVELWCEHAGIVRVGPQAAEFGDPYSWALAFRIGGGAATFEGLCFSPPVAAMRAAFRAVEDRGLKVRWERCRNGVWRDVTLHPPSHKSAAARQDGE